MANDHPTPESETEMDVFSAYVARLGADGEPPDAATYEEVREELRGVLVGELRRRGLWRAPPHYLGLSGCNWGQGALDELVTDAYTFIFIRRLRGLRRQQRLQGNIRSLVYFNVGNFLTDLQRKADPLGYRVFGRLREAVATGVERRQIFVHQREPKKKKQRLRNGTILSFQPGLAPLTPRESFEATVRRWNEDLLPDLITAEGRAVPKVVERLADKVFALRNEGVAAFRFGDLINALKDDVRKRWDQAWERSLGELGTEPDLERG
jgi:hypothetical protein